MFPLLIIIRQYFLIATFITFDFIILSDLNSNLDNLVEIYLLDLFSRLFNVPKYLMIALKTLKSSLSGSILINL